MMFAGTCAFAQERKLNIAVMDLGAISISENEALALTDELRGHIIKAGKFKVIERTRMADVLKEFGFQQTDMCNTQECYVEMGQQVGVEKMVVGSVNQLGGR